METNHRMSFTGHDRKVIAALINQGIDARLEGFTRSQFNDDGHRLSCKVDDGEMQIFVRRLSEHVESNEDEQAEMLLDDVVLAFYKDED